MVFDATAISYQTILMDKLLLNNTKSTFEWFVFSNFVLSDEFILFVCFSFGKRTGGSARRQNECFVLEPSEMIVVSTNFFVYLLHVLSDVANKKK